MKGPKIGAGMVRMAKAIEHGSADTVGAAALDAKAKHQAVIAADSGGDSVLSGVNKSKGRAGGAKVGVKYDLKKGPRPSAFIKATGPLHLLDRPTAGRVIRSSYAKGRGRRGFTGPTLPGQFSGRGMGPNKPAVLNIPGIGFRASARHPGTKGKQTWRKGRKAAEPAIRKAMTKRTTNIIKGAARL
jgi:hypothetical protein